MESAHRRAQGKPAKPQGARFKGAAISGTRSQPPSSPLSLLASLRLFFFISVPSSFPHSPFRSLLSQTYFLAHPSRADPLSTNPIAHSLSIISFLPFFSVAYSLFSSFLRLTFPLLPSFAKRVQHRFHTSNPLPFPRIPIFSPHFPHNFPSLFSTPFPLFPIPPCSTSLLFPPLHFFPSPFTPRFPISPHPVFCPHCKRCPARTTP